jgi:hypothetical protein
MVHATNVMSGINDLIIHTEIAKITKNDGCPGIAPLTDALHALR